MYAFPDITHPDLSIDQLADTVIEHCRREDSAVFDGLSYIADLDNRSGHSHEGSASRADWLAWKCDMARSTAMERVRVAHKLKELPQIEEAFRRHDISYSKVRSLTRVATPATETFYLDKALDRTAAQLDREISRIRNADVEGSTAEAWRQIEGRHVSLYVRDDGAGVVNAELPGDELEILRQALEFVSSELPEVQGQSPQKRQACALVQMARDALAGRSGHGWGMRFTANSDEVYFVRPDGSPLEVDERVATVRLTLQSPRESCGQSATERSDPSPRETGVVATRLDDGAEIREVRAGYAVG